ncbi:MAG: tRNA (adenine(22)-N(1))-methyltransferase [Mycoplasmoidaceae bacterium]
MSKTRINFLASLIEDEIVVIDIGSDHAKLSKILIDQQRTKRVINIEKNDGPLLNSISATSQAKYFGKILNIKSDGLSAISSTFFINTCVIAGMGAKTIIKILNHCKNHYVARYIIQPNNNTHLLRKWCRNNFFKIADEVLIKENEIIYEILIISKKAGYYPIANNSLLFGKINLNNKNSLFIEKWKNELVHYQKSNPKKYSKEIKRIKKVVNDEN